MCKRWFAHLLEGRVTSPEFWVRFIDILFWYCLCSVFLVVLPGNVASVIVPAADWWCNG